MQELIIAAINLLEHPSIDSDHVGRNILRECTTCDSKSNFQIIKAILRSLESNPGNFLASSKLDFLVDGLDKFVDQSFTGILAKAIEAKQKIKPLVSEEKVYAPSLGDAVEVLVEDGWVRAVVVRINAVTQECSVEYMQHNSDVDGEEVHALTSVPLQPSRIRKPLSLSSAEVGMAMDREGVTATASGTHYSLSEILTQFDQVSKLASLVYQSASVSGTSGAMVSDDESSIAWYCPSSHPCSLQLSDEPILCTVCKVQVYDDEEDEDMKELQYYWCCRQCDYMTCRNCVPCRKHSVSCTICLVGEPECVRSVMSQYASILGEISPGCTIDVIDRNDSSYFQLCDGIGYVRKKLDHGSYWKVMADRYSMRENDLIDEDGTGNKISYPINSDNCVKLTQLLLLYMEMDVLAVNLTAKYCDDQTSQEAEPLLECFNSLKHDFLLKVYDLFEHVKAGSSNKEDKGFIDEDDDLLYDMENLPSSQALKCTFAHYFQALRQAAGESHEKLAMLGLEWIFLVISNTLTQYAEALISSFNRPPSLDVELCYKIINKLFWSEHGHLLSTSLFRCLVIKAGLKAKQFASEYFSNER